MDVEVSYYQEGEPKIRKKKFQLDRVDPMVDRVGGVGVDDSEGLKTGAKKRFMGGDVKGKDVVFLPKAGEHRAVGKKGHMNVGSDAWLPH